MPRTPQVPQELRKQLAAGRVVPFVGAGLSRPSGFPDWSGLLRALVSWADQNSIQVENREAIMEGLNRRQVDRASHAIAASLGDRINEALTSILNRPDSKPTDVHRLLANVRWPAILTTNFDNLLELALGENHPVLTWRDHQNMGDVLRSGTRHLMLVHGSISDPGSIVLTPSEYSKSMRNSAQRTYLSGLLANYTMLFLGYSLSDPDIGLFLEDGIDAFGKLERPHYALVPEHEVSALDPGFYLDKYGIELLKYEATQGHPEVEAFLRQAMESVPVALVLDPTIHSGHLQLTDETNSLSATEHLARFQQSTERRAEAGFIRTARSELSGELRRLGDQVEPGQRVATAIAVAKMAIEDLNFVSATAVLQEHESLLNSPEVDQSLRIQFEQTRFRVQIESYDLVNAEQTVNSLRPISAHAADMLNDDLLTAKFLHGDTEIPPPIHNGNHFAIGAHFECVAMSGNLTQAIEGLRLAAEGERDPNNAAWLNLKRAELLRLDCRDEQAWDELQDRISPARGALGPTLRLKLQQDLNTLGFTLGKPGIFQSHNTSFDLQAKLSQDQIHLLDLLYAEDASTSQQHYESMPPLWREIRRAYCTSSWLSLYRAHHRMAREALSAGWIRQTMFHGIMGDNEAVLNSLVEFLGRWRNPEFIANTVTFVLRSCRLARHLKPGGRFLALMNDMIPDDLIPDCVTWLKDAFAKPVLRMENEAFFQAPWQTLASIAWRLDPPDATYFLDTALASELFARVRPPRFAVLKAMQACLDRADNPDWSRLTERLIPLATTDRWDYDYQEALRTLVKISEHDAASKERIAAAVFPRGTESRDFASASFAIELGRKVEPTSLNRTVKALAQRIECQICVEGDHPEIGVSHMMTIETEIDGKRVRLATSAGRYELNHVAANLADVGDQELDGLVATVLGLISNPLNIPENRLILIQFIQRVLSRMNQSRLTGTLEVLWPFATGTAPRSPLLRPEPKTTDSFQFGMTQPDVEEGVALVTATKIAALIGGQPELPTVIDRGLLHRRPVIRQHACIALLDLPEVPGHCEALLYATALDVVMETAIAALHTIEILLEQGRLNFPVESAIGTCRMTSQSPQPRVRAYAVRLAKSISRAGALSGAQSEPLSDVVNFGLADTHAGVRRIARDELPSERGK